MGSYYQLTIEEMKLLFGDQYLWKESRHSNEETSVYHAFNRISIHCVWKRCAIFLKFAVCRVEASMENGEPVDFRYIALHPSVRDDPDRIAARMQRSYEEVCDAYPSDFYLNRSVGFQSPNILCPFKSV